MRSLHPSSPARLALISAAVLFALVACSSTTPSVHLHSLMPATLSARDEGASATRVPIAVVLAPIGLPAQVDQPQWLVRLPDGSLAALEQERWAAPLRDEFRQALLEELIVHSSVVEARQPLPGSTPPTRISVDVRRFDSIPGREARIEGSWSLTAGSPGSQPRHCEWLIRETAEAGMPALAAAHRRAVVRLADGIGDSLEALQRGGGLACPRSDPR
jgi:hypothetical protein